MSFVVSLVFVDKLVNARHAQRVGYVWDATHLKLHPYHHMLKQTYFIGFETPWH